MIAQIAVSAAIYSIDKPYSYAVPNDILLRPGMRVIVPFGRGNRPTEGVVLSVDDSNGMELKCIGRILDQEPVLSEDGIRIAAFLRDRYFCTFYDAVKAMLPAGLWFRTEEIFSRTEKNSDRARLSDAERELLTYISEAGGQAAHAEIKANLSIHDLDTVVHDLIRKKYLHSNLEYSKKIQDKTALFVSLAVPAEQAMEYACKRERSAPVQYELLKLLCSVGRGSAKELCYLTGANHSTIKRLEALGLIECDSMDVFRTSLPAFVEPVSDVVLNQEQQEAFERLLDQSCLEKPGVGLLYGVTGSGKTAVYIRLIKEALSRGKDIIFLVPEIALTPQLITLLMSHFGDTVCVLHSGLRISERYDAWKRINQRQAHVVLGTRSAVFAPVADLGLIIVDEEQEHSYKSENAPRYHARDVAVFRGMRAHALVVLGSATPSVESMFLAKSGTYSLTRLSQRYNGKGLPRVEIVDMKSEIAHGNSTDISVP